MMMYYTESITRIEKIAGKKIPFYKVDLLDIAALRDVFAKVSLAPSVLFFFVCVFSCHFSKVIL